MRLLRGKPGGLIAFVAIAVMVAGGLGWATATVLRLEREQLEARADAEQANKLRLALWRLDTLVGPFLARENSRPYNHYSAIFAPAVLLRPDGEPWPPGTALETSPLLSAELPEWMLLHFQVTGDADWSSPQVLTPSLRTRLRTLADRNPFLNVTPEREQLFRELSSHATGCALLADLEKRGDTLTQPDTTVVMGSGRWNDGSNNLMNPGQQAVQPDNEYQNRAGRNTQMLQQQRAQGPKDEQSISRGNLRRNGEDWLARPTPLPSRTEPIDVTLGTMVPFWFPRTDGLEMLLVARPVAIGKGLAGQGIVLDWPRLREVLAQEVVDLFPEAEFEAVREAVPPRPELTLSALPVELRISAPARTGSDAGWTALRIGLLLAWLAAAVALLAVGLGGWSLIDLSERRIRFVSAVTHELRTPLTTLRLYLDMLTGGLVKSEQQKSEYLSTLHAETERLNRLVGNVLDFSRLENQRPRLEKRDVVLTELLDQVRATWEGRCHDVGKKLVVEDQTDITLTCRTDPGVVQQVLGNLIDNACKYSRGAEDPRIWLRASLAEPKRLLLEVEDRGPGVASSDRGSVFRPFWRGSGADVTAGGVGLGLALAQRWAALLGGRLLLCRGTDPGACFRVELPC